MAFSSSGSASASASSSCPSSSSPDSISLVGVCAADEVAVAFRTDEYRGLMTILGTVDYCLCDITSVKKKNGQKILEKRTVISFVSKRVYVECSFKNFGPNDSFFRAKETPDKYEG